MDKVFDYEDVLLIPNKCIVNSRSECDTSVILGSRDSVCRSTCQHADDY